MTLSNKRVSEEEDNEDIVHFEPTLWEKNKVILFLVIQ